MSEPITVKRKRLSHRSRYRGCLEADLFFGHFADRHITTLSAEQLDRYEALLAEDDPDLLAWICGRTQVPVQHDHDVLALLRDFRLVDRRR